MAETPEKSPTSKSAATETLASTNRDNNEDLSTKALTRGTQDVNDRNVGCIQDPHTSLEASVQGTSTKCIETTAVVLESTLHEMQNRSQYSLLLTPRPPIEGEPSGCKQEVADSVMMAGHTNGTVELAEPTEMDADVDRMTLLGGEPVEKVCGVDEGNQTERESKSRLQQTKLYCENIDQHSGNANANVPSTYKLPLEGEWTGYVSGKSNESKGCSGGMGERASVDEADSNAGHGIEPADAPNELTEFIGLSVESYVENSSDTPRVCLGGTCWRACDVKGPGCQADRSRGQADASRGQPNALNVLNRAETEVIGHGEGASTYLGPGDAKCLVLETDGTRNHTDTLNRSTDVPSIKTDRNRSVNMTENVSIPQKRVKLPDPPISAVKQLPDQPNGLGNQMDMSSMQTDTHSAGDETEVAENEMVNVRRHQIGQKSQYSPNAPENGMSKRPTRWKSVSVNDIDMYLPWNTPVEALGRTFEFGEVESGGEAIVPRSEGDGAGEGNGDQDGDNGDVGGMTSSGDVDSTRVEAALLAAGSQHMHQDQQTQSKNLLVLSMPPTYSIQRPNCSYGDVRRRRGHGRIKIKSIKVSQLEMAETTYLGRTGIMQPPRNISKCVYGVNRPRHRRGRAKIGPVKLEIERLNDKPGREDETTHHGLVCTVQPPPNDPKCCLKVVGPCHRCDWTKIEPKKLKIEHMSVSQTQQGETTYRGRTQTAQPPRYHSKRCREVYRPRCRRGCIKSQPTNVNRTQISGRTHLGRAHAIQPTWRPKKNKRRISNLTFKSRILGETWHDDGEYG